MHLELNQSHDIIPHKGKRDYMTNRLHTSLISLVCGTAISAAAFAAPTVRNVGGAGTYTSAASATSARSGSMRTTAATGGLRPSVSTTTTGTSETTTATTGSVSNGTGSMARTASSPRLSIGKYIGAPKSISTSPTGETDLTARVEKLESDVIGLESNKQDNMSGSDYIEIDEDNKILLNLELLKTALETELESKAGADGREVVIGNEENGGVDDTGIYWWYAGDTDNKQLLLSWDQLRSKLNLDAVNTSITNIIADVSGKLDKKYHLTANPTAGGMALVVDKETGEIKPTGKFVNAEWSGDDSKNKVLVTDENGNVVLSTNEMVNPDDLGDLAYLDETDLDLGDLAWEDDVSTGFIRDGAVTRAKMADEIAEIMDWINWWKTNVPNGVGMDENGNIVRPGAGSDDGYQYVLSMDKYGNAQWFRVITPENAAIIEEEDVP